jgi:hypothetical protein
VTSLESTDWIVSLAYAGIGIARPDARIEPVLPPSLRSLSASRINDADVPICAGQNIVLIAIM